MCMTGYGIVHNLLLEWDKDDFIVLFDYVKLLGPALIFLEIDKVTAKNSTWFLQFCYNWHIFIIFI